MQIEFCCINAKTNTLGGDGGYFVIDDIAIEPTVIIGDVNGDCVMDALDCTVLSECMYEREKFNNDSCWVAADYNRDDVFNVIDFQLVVNDSVELL